MVKIPQYSMRISNFSMSRNYRQNLNNAQAKLYQANQQVATGRRFNSMDEDVAAGVRAFTVRRNLQKIDTYIDNTREAQSFYKAAEDYVTGIVRIGQDAADLYNPATSGQTGPDEYKAIVAQMKHLRGELLNTLNAEFSDRFLFGGSQTSSRPFSVDEDGELNYSFKDTDGFYHKVKVKDIDKEDPAYSKIFDDPSFLDIGLGLHLDAGDKIISSSAFDRSINGLNIIGIGEENMYDILSKVIDVLENGNPNLNPELLTKLNDTYKHAAVSLTEIGSQTVYLDTSMERLKGEKNNLIERQDGLEFIPRDEAIIYEKMQEYAYNAALAMGQSLLQPSLFSFLK